MHLTGSLSPAEFIRFTTLDEGRDPSHADVARAYDNRGPEKFFTDLDRAARLWSDPARLAEAATRVIDSAFDHGARHLELLCTPSLSRQQAGIPILTSLKAVEAAFESARGRLGLTGGVVVELHRPDGAEGALEVVEAAIVLRDRGLGILGVGNDGNHRLAPLEPLAPAYRRAKEAGLRLTGHAMSPDDVLFALDIGFDRIDHGWAIANHPQIVSRIVDAGTTLTFTPMAYTLGGHRSSISWEQAHRILSEAGVPLVIGTDDPALHHTDLTHSYELMMRRLGWNSAQLSDAARLSFQKRWALDGDEAAVAAHLAEIDRLEVDPRGSDIAGG